MLLSRYSQFVVTITILLFGYFEVLAFSGGIGSIDDPYRIANITDLKNIEDGTDASYVLVADIDGYNPNEAKCKNFKGKFDGNGFSISLNTTIDYHSATDEWKFGLFKTCTGAELKNLSITGSCAARIYNYKGGDEKNYHLVNKWSNIDAYLTIYFSKFRVGGLCGEAVSSSFIDCYSSVNLIVSTYSTNSGNSYYDYWASDAFIGGLVGAATDCNFERCSSSGTIETKLIDTKWPYREIETVNIPEASAIGGIVGLAVNSELSNCFSTSYFDSKDYRKSNISNGASTGGLIGLSKRAEINCCYFAGGWQVYSPVACLVGNANGMTAKNSFSAVADVLFNGTNLSISNCYCARSEDIEGSGSQSVYGETVNISNLSVKSWFNANIPAWDFSEVWYMPTDSQKFPQFKINAVCSYEGILMYGETLTFESSNPYSPIEFLTDLDDAISVDGNSITLHRAGKFNLTVKQEAKDNFKSLNANYTLSVKKAPLIIGVQDCTMTYGDECPEPILTYDGFVFDDGVSSLTTVPTVLCDASNRSDAGEYPIVLTKGSAENYDITLTNGKCRVMPRELLACPRDAIRKYGDKNPTFTIDYSGFVNGDNRNLISTSPTVYTEADKTTDVGQYDLYCKGGAVHKNYSLKLGLGTLTIEKANLRIGVKNASREVGTLNPPFELTYSGFKNEDNEFSLNQLPIISCDADINSPAGQYPITLSGGEDSNYSFILTDGTLTVYEKPYDSIESVYYGLDYCDVHFYTLSGVLTPMEKLIKGNVYMVVTPKGTYKVIY